MIDNNMLIWVFCFLIHLFCTLQIVIWHSVTLGSARSYCKSHTHNDLHIEEKEWQYLSTTICPLVYKGSISLELITIFPWMQRRAKVSATWFICYIHCNLQQVNIPHSPLHSFWYANNWVCKKIKMQCFTDLNQ